MDKYDLYKLKAEDFARNFLSLRDVEWKVTWQLLTGYAAIAAAYPPLRKLYVDSQLLTCAAVVAPTALFVTGWYLSARIQERLHNTRRLQNAYLTKLHEELAPLFADRPPELPVGRSWPPGSVGSAAEAPDRTTRSLSAAVKQLLVPQDVPIHAKYYAFRAQMVLSSLWWLGLIVYVGATSPRFWHFR